MGELHPPLLTIAISSAADRAGRIAWDNYPSNPAWRYSLIVQRGDFEAIRHIPRNRHDIEIHFVTGYGVAGSRNVALGLCDTELLLFSDDDVQLNPVGIIELVKFMEADKALSIVTGITADFHGNPLKSYPSSVQRLSRFNSAKTGTVEMAIRVDPVRSAGIKFDQNFGAGAPVPVGDEFIFVTDALQAGLQGAFAPIIVCRHERMSSGSDWANPQTTAARSRVLERVFGFSSWGLKIAFVLKHARKFRSPASFLSFAQAMIIPHRFERKTQAPPRVVVLQSMRNTSPAE